ncbi:MAG: T9SS type A sorting domain-containing protein [Candidatus Hydrothermae bacterium]|nr:T9SS type A sorting domain-containing protein [Candidatus Hydrothermae bacterium]
MRKTVWLLVIMGLILPAAAGAQQEVTIYDIQYTTDPSGASPMVGDTVLTYGIVTGIFGNNFFIEERPGGAWHGIYVYRGYNSSPTVSIGDSVSVTGIVSEYYNLTEIGCNYYGEVTILASGLQLPDTTEITIADMTQEKYEGMLAIIRNVYFVESGVFEGNSTYHIYDENGDTGIVYVKSASNAVGTTIPTGMTNVVGNMSQYSNHYEILPRAPEDVPVEERELSPTEKPIHIGKTLLRPGEPIEVVINKSGDYRLSIYNVSGSLVESRNYSLPSSGIITLDTHDLTSGVYFLKVNATIEKFMVR